MLRDRRGRGWDKQADAMAMGLESGHECHRYLGCLGPVAQQRAGEAETCNKCAGGWRDEGGLEVGCVGDWRLGTCCLQVRGTCTLETGHSTR